MKSWEIVESIHAIGYLKTYEKMCEKPPSPTQEEAELNWQEIVERNKREPDPNREPGEE